MNKIKDEWLESKSLHDKIQLVFNLLNLRE